MKKLLKWTGFLLGGLLIVLVLAGISIYGFSTGKYNNNYAINLVAVPIPTDSAAVARGKHIAVTRGCHDCHGEGLAGSTFIDNAALGQFTGSNLTPGRGGIGNTYSDQDWVRAMRHGIGPQGKPLIFMPSYEYYYLSDRDLGALVAYLKQLPPVDHDVPDTAPGLMARALMVAGDEGFQLAADRIDHSAPRPQAPAAGPTIAYGKYIAHSCTGCHGKDFAGGSIPGAPPDWPEATNLTSAQVGLGTWTKGDFIRAMRQRRRPDGTTLDPVMPAAVGKMTDTELAALWKYLQSLPPTTSDA